MLFWRKRLATRFVLAAVLLTVVSIVVVGTIGFYLGRRGIETHTDLHLQSVVSIKAEEVVTWLELRRGALASHIYQEGSVEAVDQLLVLEPESQGYGEAAALLESSLSHGSNNSPILEHMTLLDSSGRVQYTSAPPELVGSGGAAAIFAEGSKGFYVGLLWESDGSTKAPLLVMAEPTVGSVAGVVVAYLNAGPLQALLMPDPGLGPNGAVYLVQADEGVVTSDGFGRASAASHLADLMSPDSGGILTFKDPDGVKVVAQTTSVASLPWKVVATIPAEDAFSDVGDMMLLMLLALGGIAALSALGAWRLSTIITRPLKEAAAGALAIGQGDLEYRIPVRSHDEVGYLASCLNDMAAMLAEARRDLLRVERQIAYQEISQQILDAVPISLVVIDQDERLVTANDSFYRVFTVDKEGSQGRPIAELVTLGTLEPELGRSARRETVFRGRWIWKDPNGVPCHFFASINWMTAKEKEPHQVLLALEDVTDRVAAEWRYRELMGKANDGFLIIDAETGKIQEANDRAADMLDLASKEELIGQGVERVHAGSNKELAAKHMQELLERGSTIFDDLPLERRDGTTLQVQVSASLIELGERRVILSVMRDVSQQVEAVRALRESEERFRSVVEYAADALFLIDQEGNFVDVNRMASESLGYTREELLGLKIPDVEIDIDLAKFAELRELLTPGRPITLSVSHRRKDGDTFPVEVRVGLIELDGQQQILALARDITERVRVERRLQASEARFRELYDEAPVGYCELDAAGLITRVNRTELAMLGYAEEEMIGHPVWEFVADEESRRAIRDAIASGAVPSGAIEYSYRCKDASTITVSVEERLLQDEQDRIIGRRCTIQDVTERKRAEVGLREASRLASIGELAAGVAHEINNPLASILGFSELLEAEELPESVQDDIGKIKADAKRAARVVQNLLAFSRRHVPSVQFADIRQIVEEALVIKAHDLEVNDIRVSLDFSDEVPNTMLDQHQFVQLVVNLVTNAEQAMTEAHGRGHLAIRTSSLGDKIRISVADDGPGIAPDHLGSIFDPFFTTKEVGRGTGLGLSICYGIVEQHGGRVWVENNSGKGATFQIELPVLGPQETVETDQSTAEEVSKEQKRILVVDDEPNLREFICRELSSDGHIIDQVNNGSEGWVRLQEKTYDHILLDLKMPGMGGRELYRLLKESDSRQARKVIFITGDTLSAGTSDFLSGTGNPSLLKPFPAAELRRVIREAEETESD